jgi:hypothetical protein
MGIAASAAVASVAMLGAAGVAAGAHPGGGVRLTKAQQQAQRYVERAVLKAVNGLDCQPRQYRATYPGPPPPGFRGVLGIFRGAPTRRSAAAIRDIVGGAVGLYVNYVRLARVLGGVSYYVYVSDGSAGGFPPANVSRCLAAERAAFAAELPSIPTALQQPARQVFAMNLAADRRDDRQPVRETLTLSGHLASGGGSAISGATATEIQNQGICGFTCCTHGKVLSGLVPDGVATHQGQGHRPAAEGQRAAADIRRACGARRRRSRSRPRDGTRGRPGRPPARPVHRRVLVEADFAPQQLLADQRPVP